MADDLVTTYIDSQGKPQHISSTQLRNQLSQAGYQVAGVSADGKEFTFNDPRGAYAMDIPDILENLGFKVQHSMPSQPTYGGVNLAYRAAISELPDDDAKRAYIESKLKRNGVDEPKVVGRGRDWFYYEPNSGKYVGLTNHPDWDISDLGEAATSLVHGVGATLGGLGGAALAAPSGPGAIAGGAAGAGLGGMAAEGLMRGGMAAVDPDYRNTLSAKEQLKETALSGLPDTVLAGAGGAVAKGAGKMLGPAAEEAVKYFRGGPVSTAARSLSDAVVRPVGRVMDWLGGKAANSPFAQEAVAAVTPGLSQLQNIGMIAQAPEFLATSGPAALRHAAGSDFTKMILGKDLASGLEQGSKDVLEGKALSEEARAIAAPKGNVLDKFYQKIGLQTEPRQSVEAPNVLAALARRSAQGIGSEDAKAAEIMGARTGKSLSDLGAVGRLADKAARAPVIAGARIGQGIGKVGEIAGRGTSALSRAVQPFEASAEAQELAKEKLYPGIRDNWAPFSEENVIRRLKNSKDNDTFAYIPQSP